MTSLKEKRAENDLKKIKCSKTKKYQRKNSKIVKNKHREYIKTSARKERK